jgi:hypothetical protein
MAKKKAAKRKGPGRPIGPDGPTELVAVTVPKSLVAKLDALCEAKGLKRSAAVTEAIRGLLKRKGGA